jgi:hypothetical protein
VTHQIDVVDNHAKLIARAKLSANTPVTKAFIKVVTIMNIHIGDML